MNLHKRTASVVRISHNESHIHGLESFKNGKKKILHSHDKHYKQISQVTMTVSHKQNCLRDWSSLANSCC